ncbi:MAG: DUF5658 family protein [Candidatus Woesearchaeota archaeon]
MLDTIVEKLLDDKEFVIASAAYVLASTADYLYTSVGLSNGAISAELNPVLNSYISLYGLQGLLLGKSLFVGLELLAWKLIDMESNFRVESILYPAALLTAIAPTGIVQDLVIQLMQKSP